MVWPGSLLLLNGKQKGKRCLRAIDNWEGKSIGIRMDSLEKGKRSGKRFCKGRTDLLAVRGHAQDYVCVSFCATACLCNSQRLISTHCCSSSEAAQALKLRGGGPSRATPPPRPRPAALCLLGIVVLLAGEEGDQEPVTSTSTQKTQNPSTLSRAASRAHQCLP